MKTRSVTYLSLVLALMVVPFTGGCTQSSATNAAPDLTNAVPAVVTAGAEPSAAPAPAEAAVTPPAEPVLPPNILPATPLADVVKLAQSGVGESVMLAFITNSMTPFTLSSEEIVYLNDIGVPDSVITTMLQHDQGLTPVTANPAPAAAPEPPPVAAAPSYVDAPAAAPVAETPPPIVSNNYFYNSLAPYGNWIDVEGYGRCWQPTVVVANRNWQPYCDRGRWMYTDAGWYWLSDYSWGATTFHYGRWFSHPSVGWCWWPDTVWASSWVNWRYSGSYCGWAPLPPGAGYQPGFGFSFYGSSVGMGFSFGLAANCYTFVPWGNFCGARPYQYRIPAYAANQVYNNSTVLNNYTRGHNNTVANHGLSPDRVRQYSRAEVRTVKIRDQAAGGTRSEQLARDGRTLAVHRPQLTPLPGSGASRLDVPVRSAAPRAITPTLSGSAQNSTAIRVAPPVTSGTSRIEVTRAPTLSPPRVDPRSSRELQPRVVGDPLNPGRASSPSSVRPPARSAPIAPASAPKVYEPRIIQGVPQNNSRPTSAAPASSLVVIGGRSPARSGGRDYSVWSTTLPSPAASAPVSSSSLAGSPRSAPSTAASASPVAETFPAPTSRTPAERGVTTYEAYSTSSRPTYSVPGATSRSVPSRPEPNFNPQPVVPRPTPNESRVESRSAPAPSTPALAPARPPAGPGVSPGTRSR